ncbi:MAG: Stp1/IreP family PP2C-type Ser/Thr phosphatase [Thermodesulfobacteriota bacterium]
MRVEFGTDRGLVRKSNEDSLLVDEELGLFIVADGMGGHNAGEIASSLAVKEAAQVVRKELATGTEASDALLKALLAAHRKVYESSLQNPQWEGMGTTIVMALCRGEETTIYHVGDSRAYLIGPDRTIRLTTDHTMVQDWIDLGLITPEEARTHDARHGLTMALGVEEYFEPALTRVSWKKEEILLLCTDGLTDMVQDEEIFATVRMSSSTKEACSRLIELAKSRGGPDNITVMLVSH